MGYFLASTPEEIAAVYEADIGKMSYVVENKCGKGAFYENFKDMSIRKNIDYDPTRVVSKKRGK